ncbi:hypothetical protein HanIR_Chr15g0750241 [Helianthus annuus]|nr:hypothetical protein HanIR_Chr15g0750241 [Helianthus annuus]
MKLLKPKKCYFEIQFQWRWNHNFWASFTILNDLFRFSAQSCRFCRKCSLCSLSYMNEYCELGCEIYAADGLMYQHESPTGISSIR